MRLTESLRRTFGPPGGCGGARAARNEHGRGPSPIDRLRRVVIQSRCSTKVACMNVLVVGHEPSIVATVLSSLAEAGLRARHPSEDDLPDLFDDVVRGDVS